MFKTGFVRNLFKLFQKPKPREYQVKLKPLEDHIPIVTSALRRNFNYEHFTGKSKTFKANRRRELKKSSKRRKQKGGLNPWKD